MFKEAELYSEDSADHQREARRVFQEHQHLLDWSRPSQWILDVGAGSGDVTAMVIMPKLPPSFARLIGVDKSKSMVNFAQNKWISKPKLEFKVLDISESDPMNLYSGCQEAVSNNGGFDKIFSFFCLQWVQNRRQMLTNLWDLLIPGGQVFLHLVVWNGTYLVWDQMARSDKWNQYLQHIKLPLNEYVYMDVPDKVFVEDMNQIGFKIEHTVVEYRTKVFTSKGTDEDGIRRYKSVDPFIAYIPSNQVDEYMSEVWELTKRMISPEGATDYKGLTIIACKPLK